MENNKKTKQLKSIKVNDEVFARVKDLQNELAKEIDYSKKITYSQLLDMLLDEYQKK